MFSTGQKYIYRKYNMQMTKHTKFTKDEDFVNFVNN